ncbi:Exostosin family protein [Klebsormidium nitens]|uniref:Exostosin family protein n=1 Tax=Klebsormidium nitens TaxID=105231 RepID=A0A0U9HJC2_KLENI|nr:Exostosin family protein [Klebsormidium nitens]|eukprot:GAQ81951.1 Exostosin family protein [Klebsormidium nitens]
MSSEAAGLGSFQPAEKQGAAVHPRSSCHPSQLVYVYDLPPQFNNGLIDSNECAERWYWAHPRNACIAYSSEHWGIGPPLRDEKFSALGSDPRLWADTGQHALELIYHHYMMNLYPCRTTNPQSAAAFYVPLYAGIQFHIHTSKECPETENCPQPPTLLRLGWEFDEWLRRLPYVERNGGRDHFLAMGFVTNFGVLDSTCCSSGLLNTPVTKDMTIIGIEPIVNHLDRQVNVPYPTAFHPVSLADHNTHQALIQASHRPILVSFAGSLDRTWGLDSGRQLRAALKEQCDARAKLCKLLDCNKECTIADQFELYMSSTFCLQPPGDSPTRRGIFDALQAGCIPVIFSYESVPYPEFLPADVKQYAVFIPKDDVIDLGSDVIELLERLPVAEILAKRQFIARLLPRLVYRNVNRTLHAVETTTGGNGNRRVLLGWESAYEVAIEAALRKIRDRLQ